MSSSAMKLHLGAFNCSVPGWVNTDITPHIRIARIPFAAAILKFFGKITDERYEEHRSGRFDGLHYLDLTKPLPYDDESVSAVFSSHVFEHLFIDEIDLLVREIHRVLVPGGVCRIVVPDIEKIIRSFDPENPRPFLKAIFANERRATVKHAHHWGFTGSYLIKMFEKTGYSRAFVTEYRKGICPDIDKLDNRPDESIFFEAIK